MKKALTETAEEPIPITEDDFSPTASKPELAQPNFPFRLIKNDSYRAPIKPKKRITINDDELPPAA